MNESKKERERKEREEKKKKKRKREKGWKLNVVIVDLLYIRSLAGLLARFLLLVRRRTTQSLPSQSLLACCSRVYSLSFSV